MSLAKELFNRDKELSSSWNAVAKSDWFGKVLLYARGALMEADLKPGEMEGAKRFENILTELANLAEPDVPTPKSGLTYDLEPPSRELKIEKK